MVMENVIGGKRMLKELFEEQRQLINGFFDLLSMEEVEKLLQAFLNCSGTIVFTGIGKSGIVAKKVALTMLSTGTKAFYLSAVNALHGDIGILTKDDIFVIFSKSGESDELLNLVPYVRNKGASPISVTCTNTSRLSKACDLHVTLPMEKELCPFNLAPTTSASLQLLFGDVMATALMQAKQFSLDEYAMNHPSGRIGKRITVKVNDLMITDGALPLCKEEDKLIDVLAELSEKRCGCLIVVDDDQRLKGIFTDGDLRRSLQNKGPGFRDDEIKDLMTSSPKSIASDALAWDAMKMMEADQKHPVTVLPVQEDDRVVGMIKMHDIIQSGI